MIGTRAGLLGVVVVAAMTVVPSCSRTPQARSFATPEDAARALNEAVVAGNVERVAALFGPEGRDLIDSSDLAAARRRQQVFAAAFKERWRLEEDGPSTRVLVIGNEDWPFPVPITTDGSVWRFDAAAGKEEVLARRIGRNELAAIAICRTYVFAQRLYARQGHDGKPAGLFATSVRSDPGRHNGLYWPARRGEKRSPLGSLMADATVESRSGATGAPAPFHGYYFRILTTAAADAHALVAWPAQYDATGVMTFVVDRTGVVRARDLGTDTAAAAGAVTLAVLGDTWTPVR